MSGGGSRGWVGRAGWGVGMAFVVLGAWAQLAVLRAQDAGEVAAASVEGGEPAAVRVARFDRSLIPAEGRQVAALEIPAFGRWAVEVSSRVGVALQVVDRMAGAGEVAGVAGERDGRIDLFLDRGEVRVVAFGPSLGRGDATLSARPFRELSEPEIPKLLELAPVSSELGDFEQRSYYLGVSRRQRVVLEAAGRHLADLRLWQSGGWLVDAAPLVETIEPLPGRPLQLLRLTADLAPGLYRLTAYGGPEVAWSRGGAERPLHLRWGIPRRQVAGREAMTIGPFGFDRFLIPGAASFFRLELPEPRGAALELATFDPEQPFAEGGWWLIDQETVPPVAEVSWGPREGPVVVTVRGEAGQPYVLQHFAAARRLPISGSGRYWISTVHAGDAADSIDATGVLLAWPRGDQRQTRVAAAQAIELGRERGWARRFNLLAEATLFLRVLESGRYELRASGAAAEFRIDPLLVASPEGFQPSRLRPAPAAFDLDPGLYVLTAIPTEPGVLDLALSAAGAPGEGSLAEPRGAVQLGAVELAGDTEYLLLVNEQPEVAVGPLVRELPLDLETALPISIRPGEEIVLPARAGGDSIATARAEDGGALELAVDAAAEWRESLPIGSGSHRLRVRSRRDRTVAASIRFEPEWRAPGAGRPTLAASELDAAGEAPRLSAAAPLALDLEQGATASFLLEAGASALYLAETTGLLATEARLRTRVVPRLAEAAENGAGRNAAVRAYLRSGEYQLTVGARGASAGRLGVRLRRAEIRDGGRLTDGVAARATLPRDAAVAYAFEIAESGRYEVESLALGGRFDLRVEDEDGWPVAAPVVHGLAVLDLEPGRYRALVLPRGVEARAVTTLRRRLAAARREGHGPHRLALEQTVDHLWTEPAEGSERLPDRWHFSLPAAATLTATLSGEMAGEILALESGVERRPVGQVQARRPFRGELPPGDYELAVTATRRDHLAPYRVRLQPEELLDGGSRAVRLPASVAVSLDGGADVELATFGDVDVRARLFDGKGELVAAADDRPDDWNALVAGRLPRGRYRLRLDPVGATSGATTVTLRSRPERQEAPWRPGGEPLELEAGGEIHVVPLELAGLGASPHELLAVGARAAEPVALALETRRGGPWRQVARTVGREASLGLPLAAASGDAWRLRLSSLDGRPVAVRLTGFAGAVRRERERDLAGGVPLRRLAGVEPPLAVAAVELDRAGCFEAAPTGDDGEPLVARRAGAPFERRPGAWVASGETLWLAAPAATPVTVAARRLAIGGQPVLLQLDPGEPVRCDLAAAAGPVAIEAAVLSGDVVLRPLAAAGGAPESDRFDRAAAVAPQRSLALARGARAVELRAAGRESVEARVSARPLAEAAPATLAAGALDLELPPTSARRIELPGGDASVLALTLARGAAAVGADTAPAWAAGADATAELRVEAGEVLIANPTERPLAARLEQRLAAPGETVARLAVGVPFERRLARAGTVRVEVTPPGPGSTLRVRGASEARYVGADGAIERGERMALGGEPGTLFLEAGAGPVAAWIEGTEAAAPALGVELNAGGAATPVLPPAAVELAGERMQLAVEVAAPSILTLTSPVAAAVALSAPGHPARAELFPERLSWAVVVPAGTLRVSLRGFGGAPLAGRLEIAAAPLVPAGEGLGAEVLLPPGGARLYGFRVERPGMVGVGVRSSTGGTEVELESAAGERLGRGVVLWRELAPGDYRLALHAPDDAAPARVRPAIVGIAPPSKAPPEATVRELVSLERGDPPPPRAVLGAGDTRRWFEGAPLAGATDALTGAERDPSDELEEEELEDGLEEAADEEDEIDGEEEVPAASATRMRAEERG